MKKTLLLSLICLGGFAQDSTKVLNEVTVSASRISESMLNAPISVSKISYRELQNTPSVELISSLARYKGIDVSQSSLFVTSLSTRGFNSSKAERILQLADYVDFMSPTSSLYGGNWMGIPELDIQDIEIVHGANSALYGSGAFNGVIMQTSKNPFKTQGLTVSLKSGSRNLFDAQLRFATVFGKRFAFKLNTNYTEADEFIGDSDAAIKPLTEGGLAGSDAANNAFGSAYGWNRLNFYGDAGRAITTVDGSKRVYMPGYAEKDVLWANSAADQFGLFGNNLKAGSLRLNPSLHYQINDKITAAYEYRFSAGNGIFQSTSRFHWRNMKYDLHKFEIKSDKWFVRAYSMFDYGGNAYELGAVGNAMQNARINANVPTSTFANNYFSAWQQIYNLARGTGGNAINGVLQPDFNGGSTQFTVPTIQGGQTPEQAAQTAFNLTKGLQIPVGSALFNQLREKVANGVGDGISLNGTLVKGAAFANTARYNDFSAQRNWEIKNTKLVLGGSYRNYLLKSAGTLFSDGNYSPLNTEKRESIKNNEAGVYGLIQQTIDFDSDKLILSAAGRVDNFRNFGTRFSPRVSAVYNIKDKHAFRLNYATAYRQPAQLDQFIYLDYGSVLLIGNVNGGFKGLNAAGTAPIEVKPLTTEKMGTWEIGYKGYPVDYLSVDLSYYRSNYDDFIGIVRLQGREDGILPTGDFATKTGDWAKPSTDRTRGRFLQTWANFDKTVTTQGLVFSAEYFRNRFVRPYFNYTWADISEVKDLIAGWNTPKHKFNVGSNGLIIKNLNYSINYRWNSTYNYFMPFDEGQINAFGTLDAQLNYAVKSIKTTFKLGGTNLTNANAVYVYGSAPITRMVYTGAVFDFGL